MIDKELDIPMTGSEVMNDLSLDAAKVLFLAYKGLLVPFIPLVLNPKWMELCISSRSNPPENYITHWMYWKAAVEEFKLNHKDFLDELGQQVVKTWKDSDQSKDDKEKALEPTDTKKPLPQPINFFAREGDMWHIGFEGQTIRIRHLDGLQYITYLLERPGKSISCRELYQAMSGKKPDKIMPEGSAIDEGLYTGHNKQNVSDYDAKRDYWKLWQKLQDDFDNAEDSPEGEMMKKESKKKQDEITPYLKDRTIADPNDKKAQVNIRKRLDTAYKAIRKAPLEKLEKHLQNHIKPDGALGLSYSGTHNWDIIIK